MKLTRIVLASAVTAVAIVWPHAGSAQAGPELKNKFETMQSNVSRISASLENDRWSANVALWRMRLDHVGRLERSEIATMRDTVATIAAIIAQIRNPEEKERWQLNHDLWTTLLGQAGAPSRTAEGTMMAALKELEANVGRITAPGEMERWEANCGLWKAMISGTASR